MKITQALAELKTIKARVSKKRVNIANYLWRQDMMRDPHEKEGGSATFVERETQAVDDLEARYVAIRAAIALTNAAESISVNGTSKSVADWLVWRREIAPDLQRHLQAMSRSIAAARTKAQQADIEVRRTGEASSDPRDVIINISEKELAAEIEALETILGTLDGELSLKNATIDVEV
jgi:hypothetical protein